MCGDRINKRGRMRVNPANPVYPVEKNREPSDAGSDELQ
jgi:hypothetical protein